MKKKAASQKQKPTESYGIRYLETIPGRHVTEDFRCSCGGALWDLGECIKCGDCGYVFPKTETSLR